METNHKRILSKKEILLYSTGNFGISIINSTILGFVLYFYLTEGLTGVNLPPAVIGALVGMALMVGRIVDAFINPIVGWASDNTRWKKWGRRRPFVIIGIVPMTLTFILLFNPPLFLLNLLPGGTGELFLIIYLFIIISVFDALFTFVFVPIYALLPEIAPTGNERITLSVWGNIFAMLANVIGIVFAPMLYDTIGFSISSVILGIIVFISILAVLFIQEFPGTELKKQEKVSLKDSLKISLMNHPYRIYLLNQIGMQFSFRVLSAVMPFFVVSVLLLDLGDTLVMTLPYIVFALGSFPFWGWITKKIGKKRAFIYSMALFSFPLLLSYLFLLAPGNLIISTVMVAFIGIGTGGLWIFPPTIVGDIVDDEEHRIGLRRESMYYAFQEFTEKLAISLAVFLEGLILGLFVIDEVAHPDYTGTGIYVPYYIYDPLGPILLLGGLAFLPMLIALIVFIKFPKEIIVE